MSGAFYRIWKRAGDICITLGLLLPALPVFAVVALLVRWRLGTPVFFTQPRPGLQGKIFTLYKFRTMRDAFGPDGKPLPDAARLTTFGKLLRKTSLDELPQLWNVLRGDMSLIGPRPLLAQYLPLYSPRQSRRHEVRPGITGWAQVNGRNAIDWEEKFELDVWYVDHCSLAVDLRILWLTVASVLRREGVSNAGHVTMPYFEGNCPADGPDVAGPDVAGPDVPATRSGKECSVCAADDKKFCCDLCGGEIYEHLYDDPPVLGEQFSLVRCVACGLICTWPQPAADFLERLYSADNYAANTISGRYTLDQSFSRNNHPQVLERLDALCGATSAGAGRKLLDVGCGAGQFLEAARERGWDIYGLEPSGGGGAIAREKFGDRVQTVFLQDAGYAEASFDVVSIWGVLEHVPSPAAILREAYRILRPGGILFTHTPNYNWLALKRRMQQLKGAAGSIEAHEHLYQFTAPVLKKYFSKCGFAFLREEIATPYYFADSPAAVNLVKRGLHAAVQTVFAVTGINYGGLLLYARKAEGGAAGVAKGKE